MVRRSIHLFIFIMLKSFKRGAKKVGRAYSKAPENISWGAKNLKNTGKAIFGTGVRKFQKPGLRAFMEEKKHLKKHYDRHMNMDK